jgi:hypothetical protein
MNLRKLDVTNVEERLLTKNCSHFIEQGGTESLGVVDFAFKEHTMILQIHFNLLFFKLQERTR